MAFGGQVFKKKSGGNGNDNDHDSAFSVGGMNVEIPEIEGVMEQIDKTMAETKGPTMQIEIKMPMPMLRPIERTERRGCGCWGD